MQKLTYLILLLIFASIAACYENPSVRIIGSENRSSEFIDQSYTSFQEFPGKINSIENRFAYLEVDPSDNYNLAGFFCKRVKKSIFGTNLKWSKGFIDSKKSVNSYDDKIEFYEFMLIYSRNAHSFSYEYAHGNTKKERRFSDVIFDENYSCHSLQEWIRSHDDYHTVSYGFLKDLEGDRSLGIRAAFSLGNINEDEHIRTENAFHNRRNNREYYQYIKVQQSEYTLPFIRAALSTTAKLNLFSSLPVNIFGSIGYTLYPKSDFESLFSDYERDSIFTSAEITEYDGINIKGNDLSILLSCRSNKQLTKKSKLYFTGKTCVGRSNREKTLKGIDNDMKLNMERNILNIKQDLVFGFEYSFNSFQARCALNTTLYNDKIYHEDVYDFIDSKVDEVYVFLFPTAGLSTFLIEDLMVDLSVQPDNLHNTYSHGSFFFLSLKYKY